MSERHPVLAAWDQLAEKLGKEGLTKREVRFKIPGVGDYFALVWTEVFVGQWMIVASTHPRAWSTLHKEHVEDLTRAVIYAPDFVHLVRRTHLIVESVNLLTKARAVIERGWCQGAFARDAQGQPVAPTDPLAETFCIRGATRVIEPTNDDLRLVAHSYLEDVIKARTYRVYSSLASYNDYPSRTQAEVLAVFDAAISQVALRKRVRAQELTISTLQTNLNSASDPISTERARYAERQQRREDFVAKIRRELSEVRNTTQASQEQKTMSGDDRPMSGNKPVTDAELSQYVARESGEKTANVVTPIPGLQYAVRDIPTDSSKAAEANPTDSSKSAETRSTDTLRDLQVAYERQRLELAGAKYEVKQLKEERDALLRQLTSCQKDLEDTTMPDTDVDQGPELEIISEVLPRLCDLPIAARGRVLEYLVGRLVGDFTVGKRRG